MEYYATLNPTTMQPRQGRNILALRNSSCYYEVEKYRVNIKYEEDWKTFVEQNKILYWCYLEDYDNLVIRNAQVTSQEHEKLEQLARKLKKADYDY